MRFFYVIVEDAGNKDKNFLCYNCKTPQHKSRLIHYLSFQRSAQEEDSNRSRASEVKKSASRAR